ncbi:hypothetical protein BDF20DRAFT_823804 [Mycotypha africana]|uniref:uncharacterized protein n=1 Tax=Mycotypha africana TaxID=64632 RepID=UPI002300196C|nr:uncharacterized protein BDF20DRAFT_823804 [Mycotypha africana]KAI8973385.1 hypothetical protein BDF20DRAFT_823804 [Mycotypha africana]
MNLKGESESDKDLIIYSLNESLQIYKDTVERIQGEKDDLEFQYEQTKREEAQKMEQEKTTLTQLKASTEEKRATLESVYQHLMKELAAKNLDYQRMESRFHSHKNKGAQRSSVDEEQDDVDGGKQMSIQEQILTLLKQVEELCQPLAAASAAANSNDKGSSKSKNSHPMDGIYLDKRMIPPLAERLMMQILMDKILFTSIYPGVSMNKAFGTIHKWVDKRNYTWAARLRQQISVFIVKQSTEEKESIDKAIESILEAGYDQLCTLYNRLKRKWSEIVRRALKLTLAIKEQDDPIILIHPVDEGAIYDENTMKAVNIKEKNETEGEDGSEGMASVAFMITPIFMTSPYCEDPEKVFVVPAKVYCDTTTH